MHLCSFTHVPPNNDDKMRLRLKSEFKYTVLVSAHKRTYASFGYLKGVKQMLVLCLVQWLLERVKDQYCLWSCRTKANIWHSLKTKVGWLIWNYWCKLKERVLLCNIPVGISCSYKMFEAIWSFGLLSNVVSSVHLSNSLNVWSESLINAYFDVQKSSISFEIACHLCCSKLLLQRYIENLVTGISLELDM